MVDYAWPSAVHQHIERKPSLVRLAEAGDFVGLRAKLPREVQDGLVLIGLKDVVKRKRFQIRRAVKAGKAVKTRFTQIQRMEDDTEHRMSAREDEIAASSFSNIVQKMHDYASSVLAQWQLDNGQMLGDATVGYLRQLAAHEEDTAAGHLDNARFYQMIAADHPDDAVVREVVDVEKAETYRVEVFGGIKEAVE